VLPPAHAAAESGAALPASPPTASDAAEGAAALPSGAAAPSASSVVERAVRWPPEAAAPVTQWLAGLVQRVRAWPLATTLFVLALGVYVLTRLWGIDSFPVFFYSDEANYVIFANELTERGFRGSDGQFLPLYFLVDSNRWAPLSVVYFQLVSSSLLGNSIFVARATNALISLLAVVSVGVILRNIFRLQYWWAPVLILGMTPAYFLYSRTVFEVIIMVAFYAAFLLAYLLYRTQSPRYLYLALGLAGAAFYTYSAAQPLMLLTAVVLGLADLRYHLTHRRLLLKALPLVVVLAVPFIRFRLAHPNALEVHLGAVFSYWVEDIPLTQKLGLFLRHYAYGLSPQFWFWPGALEDPVLPNQHIPGRAHFGLEWLPLAAIGLWICLRHWRDVRHRTVLLAMLCIPMASVLDSAEVRRLLAMAVPLAIIVGLGLERLLNWLNGRFRPRLSAPRQAWAVFGVLAVANLWTLGTAVINGPTWNTDYGLGGVQFGVKQIFVDTVPKYLRADPTVKVAITPVWANNTHVFPSFFYSEEDQARVRMGVIYDYLREIHELENTLMIMIPSEFEFARTSPVLEALTVEELLFYPDGRISFYVTRPVYADNAAEMIELARLARQQPVETELTLAGQPVTVRHSLLGSGEIGVVFDGITDSVVRGLEANPFLLELAFGAPRAIAGAALTLGSLDDVTVEVVLTAPDGASVTYEQRYTGLPGDPTVDLGFPDGPAAVAVFRLEITNNLSGATAQIHVRELVLR
jgi:hypothetical protein